MALDHGLLNLPLNKRGSSSFHKELDNYLAKQAEIEQERQQSIKLQHASLKEKAKALRSVLTNEQIKKVAKSKGLKFSELRDIIDSDVSWNPKKAIKLINAVIELASK